jgi:hypothetical protein
MLKEMPAYELWLATSCKIGIPPSTLNFDAMKILKFFWFYIYWAMSEIGHRKGI